MKKKFIFIFIIINFLFFQFLVAAPKEIPRITKKTSALEKPNWRPWLITFSSIAVAIAGLTFLGTKKKKKN